MVRASLNHALDDATFREALTKVGFYPQRPRSEIAIKLISGEHIPTGFFAEELDGGRRSFFGDDDLHLGFAVAGLVLSG